MVAKIFTLINFSRILEKNRRSAIRRHPYSIFLIFIFGWSSLELRMTKFTTLNDCEHQKRNPFDFVIQFQKGHSLGVLLMLLTCRTCMAKYKRLRTSEIDSCCERVRSSIMKQLRGSFVSYVFTWSYIKPEPFLDIPLRRLLSP